MVFSVLSVSCFPTCHQCHSALSRRQRSLMATPKPSVALKIRASPGTASILPACVPPSGRSFSSGSERGSSAPVQLCVLRHQPAPPGHRSARPRFGSTARLAPAGIPPPQTSAFLLIYFAVLRSPVKIIHRLLTAFSIKF